MLEGFSFLVGTGVCWAGLAAVTAAGAVRHVPASKIQPYSAMLVLACCGWIAVFLGGPVPSRGMLAQSICLVAAGACNYYMLNLVQRAMTSGRNGVVWAFTQSSMIWPFLMGICCFGEPATATRFYLHYIEPRCRMVGGDLFEFSSLEQLKGLETMFGIQFENLVLNNLQMLFPMLGLEASLVLSAAPYCQRAASGREGCQIDLMIQTQRPADTPEEHLGRRCRKDRANRIVN